jgi:hypothetical protein
MLRVGRLLPLLGAALLLVLLATGSLALAHTGSSGHKAHSGSQGRHHGAKQGNDAADDVHPGRPR